MSFLKKYHKKEYKIRSIQWITVAKVQWNFLETSLAGIMILYLLVMAQRLSSAGDGTETLSLMVQRPSPLGTNVETSEVESVMVVVPVFFK